MLVCNLNIGTYRDAIGYRRHSCGVIIYNQIREKEQLKGTETPLITAGSFDWNTVFSYIQMYHQERNNSVWWLYYWSTRLCCFFIAKFYFLSMSFTVLYNYCLILIYCFYFSSFLSLINCWIPLWHSKEKRIQTQHPPFLNQNQTAEWVPQKWKEASLSQISDVIPSCHWLVKRLKD